MSPDTIVTNTPRAGEAPEQTAARNRRGANKPILTVQEGRWYKTRGGRVVGPIKPNPGGYGWGDPEAYPWLVPSGLNFYAYSIGKDGRRYKTPDHQTTDDLILASAAEDACLAAFASAPVSAQPTADPAASSATPTDLDRLAAVLEAARREAETMTARHAPTMIAIGRIVGRGYPLGDAMHAIAAADQMAFAGLRQQAVDMLSEAIVALAVASVMIEEGRE